MAPDREQVFRALDEVFSEGVQKFQEWGDGALQYCEQVLREEPSDSKRHFNAIQAVAGMSTQRARELFVRLLEGEFEIDPNRLLACLALTTNDTIEKEILEGRIFWEHVGSKSNYRKALMRNRRALCVDGRVKRFVLSVEQRVKPDNRFHVVEIACNCGWAEDAETLEDIASRFDRKSAAYANRMIAELRRSRG